MTVALVFSVAIAGGFGASLRYLVDRGVHRLRASTAPIGIFVVNVSASVVTGAVAGLADLGGREMISDSLRFIIVVGFLGGYSTLSTVAVDTVRLIQQRRFAWVAVNSVGMLVVSILATFAGFALITSMR